MSQITQSGIETLIPLLQRLKASENVHLRQLMANELNTFLCAKDYFQPGAALGHRDITQLFERFQWLVDMGSPSGPEAYAPPPPNSGPRVDMRAIQQNMEDEMNMRPGSRSVADHIAHGPARPNHPAR